MDISYCGDKTGFPRPGHIYEIYALAISSFTYVVISSKLYISVTLRKNTALGNHLTRLISYYVLVCICMVYSHTL